MLKAIKNFPVLSRKSMMISIIVWLIICSILFVAAYLIETNQKAALIKVGVSISKEISSQSGLPLLERNIDVLSQLIEKITEQPEVVFASIIDHKNKLIAYTDQAQFSTLYRQNADERYDVHYWRITDSDQRRVMNFSSDITFSGTRMGEVFISISAEKMGYLKHFFSLLAVLSVLVIIILYALTGDKTFLSRIKKLNIKHRVSDKDRQHADDDAQFCCPMCGHQKPFSLNGFQLPDLETFLILKGYPEKHSALMLEDIIQKKDLGHLRHLISNRCFEIVKAMNSE